MRLQKQVPDARDGCKWTYARRLFVAACDREEPPDKEAGQALKRLCIESEYLLMPNLASLDAGHQFAF